jgi:hypothetical protein
VANWLDRHDIPRRIVVGRQSIYPHLRDPAWLRRRYVTEGRSTRSIAAELGCNKRSVRLALRRHRIPIRPGGSHG